MKVKLVQTCGACPEQYDAYIDGHMIGYLRLRHGSFTVMYDNQLVYHGHPDGDGCFKEYERPIYLSDASKALIKAYREEKEHENKELPYEITEYA